MPARARGGRGSWLLLVAAAACLLAPQQSAAADIVLDATRSLGAEAEPGQDIVVNATVRPGAAAAVELVFK
jgi:hypothetical protein